ncbi:hypothetical protein EMIT0P4_560002 [Pseudomonas sp. IT-P4]
MYVNGAALRCTGGAAFHGCVWLFIGSQKLVGFVPFFKILSLEWLKVFLSHFPL